MKYRSVGKSTVHRRGRTRAAGSLSQVHAAEDVAKETVKLRLRFRRQLFDRADAYFGGGARPTLPSARRWKQYPRKELVISSKVYFTGEVGVNDRGLSCAINIFESIDQTPEETCRPII